MKKIFTLDELYECFSRGDAVTRFSSDESGAEICVSVPGKVMFAGGGQSADGLLPVSLKVCHTDRNGNNTSISEETMAAALPSLRNRPILGYIHEVDGEPQFFTHNIEIDDSGEIEYLEVPVGVFPESCGARLERDEENDKVYCVADGYIYEVYSKAADIIQREGVCPVSAELRIKKMSYDAKLRVLVIEDFYFDGVTILGVDDDGRKIKPGMVGSEIRANVINFERKEGMTMNDITFSIASGKVTKNFSLSLSEKESALTELVNEAYSEEDDEFYRVDVYDDDGYLVMIGLFTHRAYRQSYTEEDGNFRLTGERAEVRARWLTESEEAAFDALRGQYDAVAAELGHYKAEKELSDKKALLESSDYSVIAKTDEFRNTAAKVGGDADTMTYDELKSELDGILLNCAKNGTITFAAADGKKETGKRRFADTTKNNKKVKRYGDLFKEI